MIRVSAICCFGRFTVPRDRWTAQGGAGNHGHHGAEGCTMHMHEKPAFRSRPEASAERPSIGGWTMSITMFENGGR
jgi:hypothetical protein